MRRALLVVTLLAVPAAASAQAQGAVLFENERASPMTVNARECDPANNAQVTARWSPLFLNGNTNAPATGKYFVYGSNQAPTGTGGSTGTLCRSQDDTQNNIRAARIDDLDDNDAGTSAVISLPALLSAAGKGCENGAIVYICVQGVLNDANNSATNFAVASASVTIATTIPKIPVITGVTPGDRALNVFWEPGTAGTATGETREVELLATPIATTTGLVDARGPRTAGRFDASPARFEDLVNTVVYDLQVRAFTDADNPSSFSPAGVATGMPQFVNDFWDAYKEAGGRDDGGCSSGLAGPLGLLVLAGVLALTRRRT